MFAVVKKRKCMWTIIEMQLDLKIKFGSLHILEYIKPWTMVAIKLICQSIKYEYTKVDN
jgi:hypothetical protein